MADDISVEEQRQIDAAIALSMGQEPPQEAKPTNSNETIYIDDDDDEDDDDHLANFSKAGGVSLSQEAVKRLNSTSTSSINASRKHVHDDDDDKDDSASVDSEATELSIEDMKDSRPDERKKGKRQMSEEISEVTSKKARNEKPEADTKLDIPHRTQNMDPSRYLLGGVDRAELERQRLARVAARQAAQQADGKATSSVTGSTLHHQASSSSSSSNKASVSTSSGSRVAALASLNSSSDSTTPTLPSTSTDSAVSGSRNSDKGKSRFGTLSSLAEKGKNAKYWQGIVRPTSSRHHSGYECFTFKDMIGDTDDLDSALLATFCGEPEWIHSHFPSTTKIALVMPCAEHNKFQSMQIAPNMKLMNPVREVESRGVMHIKLVLLYHKTYLRVAVATANLIDYDWHTIENAVYIQDFPRTSTPTDPASSPFLKTLIRSHKSLGTPTELYKNALCNFDYSAAAKVRLVLSVPGNFKSPSDLSTTGHTGLAHSLQELGLSLPQQGAKLDLEAQGSSIGSYTLDWMRTFYRSCLGWDPKSPNIRTASSRHVVSYRKDDEWPDLKIVYPTFKTVKESINGTHGGGTIFCPLEYWHKPKFPRQLFYDSRSKREGLLQHTKMILGIAHADVNDGKAKKGQQTLKMSSSTSSTSASTALFKPYGWLYVGSHNFTPAAWGRYSEKTGNLSIANHELGVVVPLTQEDLEAEGSFLVTWKRPLQKYTAKDTPWDQHTYRKNNS